VNSSEFDSYEMPLILANQTDPKYKSLIPPKYLRSRAIARSAMIGRNLDSKLLTSSAEFTEFRCQRKILSIRQRLQ
jgi:hypothetical protein